MGNIVELIMAVEEAFAVKIPDEDAEKLATVGDWHSYLCARFAATWGESRDLPCPNLSAFHRVRREVLATGRLRRAEIRPATSLEACLPRRGIHARQESWHRFSNELGVDLPSLKPGAGAETVIFSSFIFSLITAVCCTPWLSFRVTNIAFLPWLSHPLGFVALFVTFVATVGVLLFAYTRGSEYWGCRLPADFSNIGQLTRWAATRRYAERVRSQGTWNEGQLWHALRAIVAEETALKPERIERASRLVEDLDFD